MSRYALHLSHFSQAQCCFSAKYQMHSDVYFLNSTNRVPPRVDSLRDNHWTMYIYGLLPPGVPRGEDELEDAIIIDGAMHVSRWRPSLTILLCE